jgi:hypothetical protein
MRKTIIALAGIAILTLIGCTSATPVAAQTHLVSAAIQGDWVVSQGKPQSNMEVSYEQVGVLTIEDATYKFQPLTGKNVSDIDQAFRFLFNAPTGEIEIKYEPYIHADDKLEALESQTILATCIFKSGATVFYRVLIRVAEKPTGLYFHSMISELNMWGVGKKLD